MVDTHNPKKVARSGAIYTGALILQKILSFTYFSLVARALGPESLGTYIFVLSFAAFFSLVVDFGFVAMAIRAFAQDKQNQKHNFKIFFSIRILLAMVSVVVLFSVAFILGYSQELISLLLITSIIMVMDAFTSYFYTVLRARQNLLFESIGTVIFQLIVFSFGVYTILHTSDIPSLLFVIFVGSAFHLIYSSTVIRKKTNIVFGLNFNWLEIKSWLAKAVPFFFGSRLYKSLQYYRYDFNKEYKWRRGSWFVRYSCKNRFYFSIYGLGNYGSGLSGHE